MYALHPQTDRQNHAYKKNTNQSSGLVSETLSFSEGPGLGFMTRSGAMQAREPTPRASCVCGSSREGGGAILVPTQCTEQVPCISAVTQPHLLSHKDAQEGSYIHPANPSTRWGPGFLLDARSTPDLLLLCPSAPPYYLMYYTPTFGRNFLVCHSCSLRWRLMET